MLAMHWTRKCVVLVRVRSMAVGPRGCRGRRAPSHMVLDSLRVQEIAQIRSPRTAAVIASDRQSHINSVVAMLRLKRVVGQSGRCGLFALSLAETAH